jgi:AcrR family transcriptional regulator
MDRAVPLREQQRAFTRSRLMEAGRQVFAARGYPDATVDDIASQAGASRATFYLHFKSKCELAAALVDEYAPMAVERYQVLDALLAEGGPGLRDQLRAWLSGWLDIWTDDADASHALLQAAMLESEVQTHLLRLSETLIDTLHRYFGSMSPPDRAGRRAHALVLEIMTQRIFALASMSQLPLENERMLDILLGMWLEVLVERRPGGAKAVRPGRPKARPR